MRQRLAVCGVCVDDPHLIRRHLHEQYHRVVAVSNIPHRLHWQVWVMLDRADPTVRPSRRQLPAVIAAEDRRLEAAQILLLELAGAEILAVQRNVFVADAVELLVVKRAGRFCVGDFSVPII